jgi:hypothetical protein
MIERNSKRKKTLRERAEERIRLEKEREQTVAPAQILRVEEFDFE